MGRNLKNALIAFLVPLPSILFYTTFLHHHNPIWSWCFHHPFLLVNLLFFFNINVLFWIISQIQSSHWMIDVYWTVIPVLLAHYFQFHPSFQFNLHRSRLTVLLTWIWSIRLTHSYFRREKWQWGVREDWRFTDLAQQYGKNWWWISFFAVYLIQQVFLIGVCLPLYIVHSVNAPLNLTDVAAAIVCLTGVMIAYIADTQLHEFVSRNEQLKRLGKPLQPNLDAGLWYYSRHPNYFGEQVWWWGLAVFGWNLGCEWVWVGAMVNTVCLAYVTVLVERKMVKLEYRAEEYKMYQKRTSVWVPWFKFSQVAKEKAT
ncbi:uncharacterized protein C594.04c-like [Bidens hawaiensis]|uniref:uncharacterized protein C594.04c-like n=1 Tax=Bidens hawaiensis TaxID=980011 RepID=UPI00404A05A2